MIQATMTHASNPPSGALNWRKIAVVAATGFLSAEVIWLGCLLAATGAWREPFSSSSREAMTSPICHGDGSYYLAIAGSGYDDDPSTLAFFPGYPALVGFVAHGLHLGLECAAIMTAHLAALVSTLLFAAWAYARNDGAGRAWSVAAFCLFPTAFFFRMPYSESLFVALASGLLLGMERGWKPFWLSLICGAASGVRPVGLVLLIPLSMYAWNLQRGSWRARAIRLSGVVLLGVGGLAGFLLYLQYSQGSVLLFCEAQQKLQIMPDRSIFDSAIAYLSWEPLWQVYDSDSAAYWYKSERHTAWASLSFMNPVLFLLMLVSTIFGWTKHWLTTPEAILAVALIAVPYLTKGLDAGMLGQGRYAASCLPAYIVLGRVLEARGTVIGCAVLTVFIALYTIYTLRFLSGANLI
jgi:hypothetical protein